MSNTFRTALGATLREERKSQGRRMQDVANKGFVSLGYLSEIETGKKEVSSTILNQLSLALYYELPLLLRDVADKLEQLEGAR